MTLLLKHCRRLSSLSLSWQALLEERQRVRVDLQPLLRQLSSRLAAALGGGGGTSLSALQAECVGGGGTECGQASTHRHLLALLSAVHQHNSRAGGAGGSAAASGAVAALAAALGGRQLALSSTPGGGDVAVGLA